MLNQKRQDNEQAVDVEIDHFDDKRLFDSMWNKTKKPLGLSKNELDNLKNKCYLQLKTELGNELLKICNDKKLCNLTIEELRCLYN